MTDYRKLLQILSDGGVEFIIVGGLAATAHGSARLTQDLDIVYDRSKANLERLISALAPFSPYLRGAPHGLPFRWDCRTLENGLNFTLTTSIGDVDLLGEIAGGGDYHQLLPQTIRLELFGLSCSCLELATLIRVKRAAGRPKDFEAIAELEALLEDPTSEE